MNPRHKQYFHLKISSTLFGLLYCCIAIVTTGYLYPMSHQDKIVSRLQDTAINFDSRLLHIASLGQERLISSILWVQTLLDSDLEHYSKADLGDWMFLRFKTITDLDPYFYESYLYGGIYLSIVKDDKLGAKYIYEKGLKYFPNDFYLNLNASFHYFYELQNIDKSLECLAKIYKDPKAPRFLPSLYIRLKSTRGDLKSAFALLVDLYNSSPKDSPIRKSYEKKLYALKAEIDLGCLNNGVDQNCRKNDFHGNPYFLNKEGRYQARESWEPLRIKKPQSQKETEAN